MEEEKKQLSEKENNNRRDVLDFPNFPADHSVSMD